MGNIISQLSRTLRKEIGINTSISGRDATPHHPKFDARAQEAYSIASGLKSYAGGMKVRISAASKFIASLVIVCLCLSAGIAAGKEKNIEDVIAGLVNKIPQRQKNAKTGSEFSACIASVPPSQREEAIELEVTEGNFPEFLKRLKPIRMTHRFHDGTTKTATIFAMPDYLSVGSDGDYLLTPMALSSAVDTAMKLGFMLPTRKIVDAIFGQSDIRCVPQPLPAGPEMRSTAYYVKHDRKIKTQLLAMACAPGALVSGHKKDVVLSNRLIRSQGKIAIYGWHRLSGIPIQPLSTVHGAKYADYSHGIRLISDTVLIDGEPQSMTDLLENPKFADIVSDEGPMPGLRRFMNSHHTLSVDTAPLSLR